MAGSNVLTLTHADVAKLLAEPSPKRRAEMATKVAAVIDDEHLSTEELNLVQDIVRLMAKDVEVTVRASLSDSLRHVTRLPHDVATRLANDVENVALPILLHSDVLNEEDMLAIIKAGAGGKQEAIAKRSVVSEKVSAALISEAGEQAVAALMSNAGAKIIKRDVLPVTVTERLVTMVTDTLKDYLVSHHDLSPAMAADLVMQSRERVVVNMSGGSSQQDLEKLVAQMHRNKRLTPSLVLRTICMGDIAFFEAAISCMANVSLMNARLLIHDPGRLGLKSLYAKSGMPANFLPAVRVAIDVVHETMMDGENNDRERYSARVIERVLTQFSDFDPEDLEYLLDRLSHLKKTAA